MLAASKAEWRGGPRPAGAIWASVGHGDGGAEAEQSEGDAAHPYLIRLQCIYNFLLFHAIVLSIWMFYMH